ncbi:MAG TPA: alpha/beta hydrolase [Chitinophagaceae bacterium]|nr:alpha/beta hydrolase [Chitinophagaceae bacterium]
MTRQFFVPFILFLVFFLPARAQDSFREEAMSIHVDSNTLAGTLCLPLIKPTGAVVLIVAGSGHTNRDGNQEPNLMTNAYQQIAHALAAAGIASLRYDKRGVGESVFRISEQNLRFDHFIDDAALWIKTLTNDARFRSVIVAGHSEGSLIGMVACEKEKAQAFISLEGAAYPIDEVLKTQLKTAIPDSNYYQLSCRYIDTLKQGIHLTHSDPALGSLFRPSIQDYMINWMKYDPSVEIKKLQVPVFIIQGEHDIQVDTGNGNALKKACPKGEYLLIPGMNHVLKEAPAERSANFAVYNMPEKEVMKACIDALIAFCRTHS